jgi:hypothetical protein
MIMKEIIAISFRNISIGKLSSIAMPLSTWILGEKLCNDDTSLWMLGKVASERVYGL